MEIKRSYLAMIREYPGGWDAMAAALGMSRSALENRIYERKGQSVLVETALQMQQFSNSTHFAEAVAQVSGGVFMKLPSHNYDRDELLSKFNELYAELGNLSMKFKTSIEDGEIDRRERDELTDIGQHVHRTVEELLALTFQIYCRPDSLK
ncbi:YmfL family putative regulatory protein [Thauera propionica]|uniref:YmfL family putative regulatory protein n=1 Tax=Thauera propionica TaxID=2019431 RepID=UPI0023F504BA|nr:YmfL family putative regulatory protein [Thauera propionica]MDD3676047.1 YmfL family putative regulatory protein [Thauera propionica]